jgi:hypothetical protein
MSSSATAFLAIVWTVVIVATGFCFYKLLTSDRRLKGE